MTCIIEKSNFVKGLSPLWKTVDSRDAARKSNLCTTPLALKSSMDFFRLGSESFLTKSMQIINHECPEVNVAKS